MVSKLFAAGACLALVISCTSSEPGGTAAGGTGGGAAAGSGATAGNGAAAGAGGSAGAGTAGAAGAAGAGGGAGGGAGAPGADGGAGAAAAPFVCNQVTGVLLTSEWYLAGFENAVDGSRWQIKWQEHGYINEWANPQSTFWNAPVSSPCAQATTSPDRIVFTVIDWTITAETEWETDITASIENFKVKYPNVRRVDLLTVVRGPNNMACGTPAAGETIVMPAAEDAALAAVAAKYPGFVFVGPKFAPPDCTSFSGGGPHLTAAGNRTMGAMIGAYFATTPAP
jgi:hypothetical protein